MSRRGVSAKFVRQVVLPQVTAAGGSERSTLHQLHSLLKLGSEAYISREFVQEEHVGTNDVVCLIYSRYVITVAVLLEVMEKHPPDTYFWVETLCWPVTGPPADVPTVPGERVQWTTQAMATHSRVVWIICHSQDLPKSFSASVIFHIYCAMLANVEVHVRNAHVDKKRLQQQVLARASDIERVVEGLTYPCVHTDSTYADDHQMVNAFNNDALGSVNKYMLQLIGTHQCAIVDPLYQDAESKTPDQKLNLAIFYKTWSQKARAVALLTPVHQMCMEKRIEDQQTRVTCLCLWAMHLLDLSQIDGVVDQCKEALDALTSVKPNEDSLYWSVYVHMTMSTALLRQKKPSEALKVLLKARQFAKYVSDWKVRGELELAIAVMYVKTEDCRSAVETARLNIADVEHSSDQRFTRLASRSRHYCGVAHQETAEHLVALSAYEMAAKETFSTYCSPFNRDGISSMKGIAQTQVELDNMYEAVLNCRGACFLYFHVAPEETLYTLCELFNTMCSVYHIAENYPAAIVYARKALHIIVEMYPNSSLRRLCSFRLAEMYAAMGWNKQAYILYTKIISLLKEDPQATGMHLFGIMLKRSKLPAANTNDPPPTYVTGAVKITSSLQKVLQRLAIPQSVADVIKSNFSDPMKLMAYITARENPPPMPKTVANILFAAGMNELITVSTFADDNDTTVEIPHKPAAWLLEWCGLTCLQDAFESMGWHTAHGVASYVSVLNRFPALWLYTIRPFWRFHASGKAIKIMDQVVKNANIGIVMFNLQRVVDVGVEDKVSFDIDTHLKLWGVGDQAPLFTERLGITSIAGVMTLLESSIRASDSYLNVTLPGFEKFNEIIHCPETRRRLSLAMMYSRQLEQTRACCGIVRPEIQLPLPPDGLVPREMGPPSPYLTATLMRLASCKWNRETAIALLGPLDDRWTTPMSVFVSLSVFQLSTSSTAASKEDADAMADAFRKIQCRNAVVWRIHVETVADFNAVMGVLTCLPTMQSVTLYMSCDADHGKLYMGPDTVSTDLMEHWLRKLPALSRFVILDCCHGESIVPNLPDRTALLVMTNVWQKTHPRVSIRRCVPDVLSSKCPIGKVECDVCKRYRDRVERDGLLFADMCASVCDHIRVASENVKSLKAVTPIFKSTSVGGF